MKKIKLVVISTTYIGLLIAVFSINNDKFNHFLPTIILVSFFIGLISFLLSKYLDTKKESVFVFYTPNQKENSLKIITELSKHISSKKIIRKELDNIDDFETQIKVNKHLYTEIIILLPKEFRENNQNSNWLKCQENLKIIPLIVENKPLENSNNFNHFYLYEINKDNLFYLAKIIKD